jgi:hypothetical protein
VRKHVTKRGIRGKVQTTDLVVDLPDRTELAGSVNIALDVDGFKSLGELPCLVCPVIFLDMFAGTGYRQKIEKLEIVEAQHIDQGTGGTLVVIQREPAVKLLCARRVVESMLAMPKSRRAVSSPSVAKAILVPQIREAIVYGWAESMRTRVLTPSLMIRRMRRS